MTDAVLFEHRNRSAPFRQLQRARHANHTTTNDDDVHIAIIPPGAGSDQAWCLERSAAPTVEESKSMVIDDSSLLTVVFHD